MPSFLTHMSVLAFGDVPKPNAKRAASGEIVPIASGGGLPSKLGRRGQMKGALYSTALPDWSWTKWTRWCYPRKDGDAREHCASVESSVQQGHYTKLLVRYPSSESKAEKKDRDNIRQCAKLLVETQRNVRGEDGGVGKMVGAGDHFSYNGLVEVRPTLTLTLTLTPTLTQTQTRAQPFKAEQLLERKRKRGGDEDVASALGKAARGFEIFAGRIEVVSE